MIHPSVQWVAAEPGGLAAAPSSPRSGAFPSLSSKLNKARVGISTWFLVWIWQILTCIWKNKRVRLASEFWTRPMIEISCLRHIVVHAWCNKYSGMMLVFMIPEFIWTVKEFSMWLGTDFHVHGKRRWFYKCGLDGDSPLEEKKVYLFYIKN